MYSYTYDPETGGLLLNASPAPFSREPRPVYAPELDLLGFDRFWRYDSQTDAPYMWAEANQYFYRGRLVARLKGGNAFTAPEIIIPEEENGQPVRPEPDGGKLRPVDLAAMVAANRELLEILERTTVRRIVDAYTRHRKRLDCFHVAFSGGKDSCVLLDLVKKALPKGSFVVVFGDTGMEFPDTYEVVRQTQAQCQAEEIPFYIARSHFKPEESWQLFGPPSRVLRWCCSVHKSTPQTLKLREITGKTDYTGLAFVGVRADESATRAKYEYENYGKKIKGQYDFYPILEWSSAEIFLYIFTNNIILNSAYTKGCSRVGCISCPMSGGIHDYIKYTLFQDYISEYINIIRHNSDKKFSYKRFIDFMNMGAWKSRADGRYIKNNTKKYTEEIKNNKLSIKITNPSSNWREWIKTIGVDCNISVNDTQYGYIALIDNNFIKENPYLSKIIRQTFHKSAFCSSCAVCSANCRNGCITFKNGKIKIDGCIHCHSCHQIQAGCLLYDSLKIPQGGLKMRSVNSFTEHAPKPEWIAEFFTEQDGFFENNSLGPDQNLKFKIFLTDSLLAYKEKLSEFANIILNIGWETDISFGLILINLSMNNPQIEWYVKNLDIGKIYTRKYITDSLIAEGLKERPANSVAKAYKRIVSTQLGTILHFGYVTGNDELVRTKCTLDDPRVLLYGLFKFAEKCNNYKEFTLATLLNDSIERDGISPTRIFGLNREEAIPLLLGLSAKYPEFISATFTHDLEKIALAEDKSSQDVLALFA